MSDVFCQKSNQSLVLRVSPSSPSPVAQQMTAMSISQDSGAVDSERLEAEEAEEESTSNSSGKCHRKQQSDLRSGQTYFLPDAVHTRLRRIVLKRSSVCLFFPEPLEAVQALSDSDQTPDKNKKKNRCFSCRKKVGLTGKNHENSAHPVTGAFDCWLGLKAY